MNIAKSTHNSPTTTDQQYKWFYLIEIPGEADHWKFGETFDVRRRINLYNSLRVNPLSKFEHQWVVPDWLKDSDIHPKLLKVSQNVGTGRRGKVKEIFIGDLGKILEAIDTAVDKAWKDDETRHLGDEFDGELSLSDLDRLDAAEWRHIHAGHAMTPELTDHLLARFAGRST
jgi:hypothetical protein